MLIRRYWWILALVVLALAWWGLSRGGGDVTVHVVTVGRGTIQSTIPTNGKVEPVEWAAARAEVSGVVKRLAVTRGQAVKAGDELVELDDTSARAELAAAQARREEAAAELATIGQGGKASLVANAASAITVAQSGVEVAQRNYDTEKRLLEQQASTKYAVEQAQDALVRAKAQLASAQEQRRTLVTTGDRSVAEAKLHDADAAVSLAARRLKLTRISAPVDGVVYQFDLRIGAYLQPGDQVALVGKLDQVKISVYVDEPDLGRLAKNMPVEITWDARPGQKWSGHVEQLPTAIEALGTRNVGQVSTIVDNPQHELLPGVTVNATIVSQVVQGTVVIPKAAIRTQGSASGVYRVDAGGKLHWVVVETGVSDINNVQIVNGVQAGDRIVDRTVEPTDADLADGMHVAISDKKG